MDCAWESLNVGKYGVNLRVIPPNIETIEMADVEKTVSAREKTAKTIN